MVPKGLQLPSRPTLRPHRGGLPMQSGSSVDTRTLSTAGVPVRTYRLALGVRRSCYRAATMVVHALSSLGISRAVAMRMLKVRFSPLMIGQ